MCGSTPQETETGERFCAKCRPHVAKCAGDCGGQIRFADPPLREGEMILCAPCAEKASGKKAPVGVDHVRARPLPHERIARLVAERFGHRFGREPAKSAVASYRAQLAAWDPRLGDLQKVADAIEGWKRGHVKQWEQRHLIQPASDLDALRTIARDLMSKLTQQEMDQGGVTEER